ncbi:MAG TPA: hypothetical protein VFQ43_19295 [Nitrososphaera sp.]|nr:hypothetical protein [Nitrososphaera sp.]
MKTDERVRDLCSQLLRADNPAVIKTVAAEMKEAIDIYVESRDGDAPALNESLNQ